jgi:acetyl esterase
MSEDSLEPADASPALERAQIPRRWPDAPGYDRLSPADRVYLSQLKDAPPLGSLLVEQERERMRRDQHCNPESYPVEIEMFQTSACAVHIVRSGGAAGALPITFYLHGGGWVLGDFQTHMKLVCELAVRSGRAVAFLEYPRAPELSFPGQLDACLIAMTEVLAAAESLRLRAAQYMLVGDSSGGNLALAVLLLSQQRKLTLPARLVLLYPVTDHRTDTLSYSEFADDPNLGREAMHWFWHNYVPEVALRSDVLASPLQARRAAFAGFPPTLLITCECDVLRDQGEQLAAALGEAGVEVTAVRWLGALHGFLVTEALSRAPSAERCMEFIAQYCRELNSPQLSSAASRLGDGSRTTDER